MFRSFNAGEWNRSRNVIALKQMNCFFSCPKCETVLWPCLERRKNKTRELTCIEIKCKFFQFVPLYDAVNQFPAQRRFSLHGDGKRRMKFDVFGDDFGVELLLEDRHGTVYDLHVHGHVRSARCYTCRIERKLR